MTNRLELNWKLDGFVDEQRYYCSTTSFTAETKPAPKAVLASDVRTYIDTDVEVNKTYYTAIGSVKNSVEKLSDISSVFTNVDIYANQVVSLLRFNNNILDETAKIWTVNGTPVFEANQAKYNAWNITSAHDSNLVFDGDFTIEALVTYEDFTRLYNTLIASGNASWSSPVSFVMTYGDTAGSEYVSLRRKMALSVYTNVPLIATTSVFEANVKTHVAFQRSGSTLRVYKAGILEASVTFAGTIHFSIPTHGTSVGLTRWDTSTGYGRSLVDAMRITKGIARYNANFTPPVFL